MQSFIKTITLITLMLSFSCKDKQVVNKEKETNTSSSSNTWKSLFNGEDLEGWVVKINGYKLNDNYKNTFRVENKVLKVSYDKYDNFTDQFGHLFYKTAFSNYKLRLQYRFVGEQVSGGKSWATKNSGIMIHCQSPKSMLVNQSFPLSLEVQLLGGIDKEKARPTGNLCTPATHVIMNGKQITEHCIPANCRTYYGEEWITAEVRVRNDSITHYIDGKLVISYSSPTIGGAFLDTTAKDIQSKSGQALKSGYISLQSESHPIEFRNIEILEY